MDIIKNIIREFQAFAVRGNVIDMAIGIVIGTAFGNITTSLVNDIIMPMAGFVVGGIDFGHFAVTLKDATPTQPAVSVKFGKFLNTITYFIIVALAMFMVLKFMNNLKRKDAKKPTPAAVPSREEVLLTEIRDILKETKAK